MDVGMIYEHPLRMHISSGDSVLDKIVVAAAFYTRELCSFARGMAEIVFVQPVSKE